MVLLASSCSSDQSPFKGYNKDGYTVSVKYDANGGVFTTNTDTIVDTYNLGTYTADSEGKKHIKLFAPDSSERGNQAYTATKDNFYLAGWYTERSEEKDQDGNVIGYTYSGRWDFENDKLSLKADGVYSSENAELTLYAAWIPSFTYEFYVFGENGEPTLINSVNINPLADTELTLPKDNEESGKINAPNDFPTLDGKTYDKIYLDKDKQNEITAETLTHTGKFISENATLEDPVMKIYCTATDGVKYKITSVDQLIKNPDVNAHFTLENDLDFSGRSWPVAFSTGEFSGKIIGNGHTVKNIVLNQNNTTDKAFALFGTISDCASVKDVTFDAVTVNINKFSNYQNAAFGIFAGEIYDSADISGITVQNSTLNITKGLNLMVAVNSRSPLFGLICAVGEPLGITFSKDDVKVALVGTDDSEYTYAPDEKGQFTLTVKEQ